jgi:N-acetylmuramoyl-L-alanine amidase
MNPKITGLLFVLGALVLEGCGSSASYVVPRDLATAARRDSLIQVYRPWLEGRGIFLDPGHGGEDRVNRGPEGEAIEADVNLRVGLALREYLSAAGARVVMSREKDTSIALADRPALAVRSGAEVFVSLHHNATGTADQITNYASVYYHARPGHPDYNPANQDLARHLQRDMSYAMRNAGSPFSPTFDGTLSDFDIYPNSGFAVLRENALPAVLIEGSFFTHPPEEQRLAAPEFNRIEAWGIFLGLGKYFRSGFPSLTLLSDSVVPVPHPLIAVGLSPWSDIDTRSVDVFLDNAPVPWMLSDSAGAILISPSRDLRSGTVTLNVVARNRGGKSAWPFRKRITVMLPAAAVAAHLHPDTLPAFSGASARLVCSARDSNNDPVADGSLIRIISPGIDTTLGSAGGSAVYYIAAPAEETAFPVTVTCGRPTATVYLTSKHDSLLYVSGTVRAADSALTLAGARILARGSLADTTWPDGEFILRGRTADAETLSVDRDGYFPTAIAPGVPQKTGLDIRLKPVAERRLFGRTFLVDPRYGGAEGGGVNTLGLRSADINLEIAWRLTDLLKGAGADVHLIRSADSAIAESERTRRSAGFRRGMYIRIDAAEPAVAARAEIYRNIPNRRLAERMLAALAAVARLETTGVKPSNEPFFNDVAMGTVSVRLPSVTTGYYDTSAAREIDRIAWCLFGGILQNAGFIDPAPTVSLYPEGTPSVSLGGVFHQIPDRTGSVYFFGLDSPELTPTPMPTARTPLRQGP